MTPRLKGEGMGYPWNHSFCSAKEKVPLKYAKIGKNSEILPKKYSFSLVFLVKKYIFSEHFKLFPVAPLFCYPKWAHSSSHHNLFAQNTRIGKVSWVLIQLIPYFSIQIDLFMVLSIPTNFDWYARTHLTRQGLTEGPLNTLTSLRSW